MDFLNTAFGEYELSRFPIRNDDPLRAWDAADEYLLNHIDEHKLVSSTAPPEATKILIINDDFGALAVSLHKQSPDSWSDSYLTKLATEYNTEIHELDSIANFIPSIESLSGHYDLVLIKIPKTMALLEEQLIHLKAHVTSDTKIIAAAMSKHIHTSTLKLFEKIIGTTTTSLAVKKARLIFSHYEKAEQATKSAYPKTYEVPSLGLTLTNHANVFAKDKLDMGARFFLEQFNQLPSAKHIVDLGCGNGVLGIVAQHYQLNSEISFFDESYMAIESAKASYANAYPDKTAEFVVSNSLSDYYGEGIDLILCNPPFHQSHAVGDHIAWKMLEQSQKQLKRGGELWVVGNRHLAYHIKLKRLFGNSRMIASNKKFVVLSAKKT